MGKAKGLLTVFCVAFIAACSAGSSAIPRLTDAEQTVAAVPGDLSVAMDEWVTESTRGSVVRIYYFADRRDNPVEVRISTGGSAVTGVDYRLFDAAGFEMTRPYTITVPAMQDHASLVVRPVKDVEGEGDETIALTFASSEGGSPVTAVMTIAAHGVVEATEENLPVLTIKGHGTPWPAFRPDVYDYALRCDGDVRVASSEVQEFQVRLNGEQQEASDGVDAGEGDVITVSADGGADYHVHCLGKDFPLVTTSGTADQGWPGLIAVGLGLNRNEVRGSDLDPFGWVALIDSHGVPRWSRRGYAHDTGEPFFIRTFKPTGLDDFPFGYVRPNVLEPVPRCVDGTVLLLNRVMEESKVIRTVAPLKCTDRHDFDVSPEGNVVLISYEPVVRNMSSYGPYSTEVPTRDSVIQAVSSDGQEIIRWNSWDNIPIEDCTAHRFPDDYAHANSAQWVGDDVLVSLRGCSSIVMIDGRSGQTKWRLGVTNLDSKGYRKRGLVEPISIVGDPEGEFCGQHSARMVGDNRMLLFDNNSFCQTRRDGAQGRASNVYSRAVEYRIDLANRRALFLRDHSLGGTKDQFGQGIGYIAAAPNGNWFVSWGWDRGNLDRSPTQSFTEYNPETGEEVFSMRFDVEGYAWPLVTRAHPVPIEVRPP